MLHLKGFFSNAGRAFCSLITPTFLVSQDTASEEAVEDFVPDEQPSEATPVEDFKFMGVHTDADLQWSSNTSAVVKRARQRLHFLRILGRIDLKRELLTVFYRCPIENVLT